MALATVTLDDKYTQEAGRIFLTGTQALLRLALDQKKRDEASGLKTAGYISGYRGSPMHVLDMQYWQVEKYMLEHDIKFNPAINEDLAASAISGAQQAGLYCESDYDGVFSFWYGKGPGLDRSIDAMRHGAFRGASPHGGVLALTGDDHGQRSTTSTAHCEVLFEDLLMPVLYPANVQEVLDLGLHGVALSRFSGLWVGFKLVFETIDTSVTVEVDSERVQPVVPAFEFGDETPEIRNGRGELWYAAERRIRRVRLPAALAYARANRLNYCSHSSDRRRYGIIAAGKAWLDVQQALRDLGIDEARLSQLGIVIYKVGMVYPHDLDGYRGFCQGLDEVLVVEEKRQQMEGAVKDACYSLEPSERPRVVGRYDEDGCILIDELGELTPDKLAVAIAGRIRYFHGERRSEARLQALKDTCGALDRLPELPINRLPYFCSGCPHNTSTKTPEGSRGQGGVGCHGMALYMDRSVVNWTQMGGEGSNWIGESQFVRDKHVFQIMGDGTYYHSGSLAIRAAVAAKTPITYKILFNDAVAMTGGQPVDGPISVPMIARQVHAEGVRRISIVSDEPEKFGPSSELPAIASVDHRRDLDTIQKELREYPGVSVLIYDQTCAAEKRRRRKKGLMVDPDKRAFINDRVCEGCGDCSDQSNCLSVIPKTTPFGVKREIEQSSCNKDFSCVNGFCPSFVTVIGGRLRKGKGLSADGAQLPQRLPDPPPARISRGGTFNIMIAGVGGTGVVTIGALISMAAHMEGKTASVVDQLGMAQKGGAVISHLRIAEQGKDILASRVNQGSADLLIACDNLVASTEEPLASILRGHTTVLVNSNQAITGDFTRNPDLKFPSDIVHARIIRMAGADHTEIIDASQLATKLLGDALGSNLFLVGYAWQKGLLPVSEAGLMRAIELNGVAVDWNKQAFWWGRFSAIDMDAVTALLPDSGRVVELLSTEELIQKFEGELVAYQNLEYAARYRAIVDQALRAEKSVDPDSSVLTEAVARYAYKLMAYKDEYEVARLYSDKEYMNKLRDTFEGDFKLQFHLAPPLLSPRDKQTGHLRKITFGPWMMRAFLVLSKFKFLRGTAWNVFGKSSEREKERQLIKDYEDWVMSLGANLTGNNIGLAVEIASIPEYIRGYGHVKEKHMESARKHRNQLLQQWRGEEVEIVNIVEPGA